MVAHLLGDDLGRLARMRDGHPVDAPAPGETFEAFFDRLNDEWVHATSRVSSRLLIDMLAVTTHQVLDLWRTVDLDATGATVSWAGPDPAPVWLDCARDFTEYWVHQQQIREASGRPGGADPQVVHAVGALALAGTTAWAQQPPSACAPAQALVTQGELEKVSNTLTRWTDSCVSNFCSSCSVARTRKGARVMGNSW